MARILRFPKSPNISNRIDQSLTRTRRAVSIQKTVPLSKLTNLFSIDDPRKTQLVKIDYARLNQIIAEEK